MKKLALFILVLVSLGGCVAYPVPYETGPQHRPHGGYYGHGHGHVYGDRDGDGVQNRHDRRPNNPRRY